MVWCLQEQAVLAPARTALPCSGTELVWHFQEHAVLLPAKSAASGMVWRLQEQAVLAPARTALPCTRFSGIPTSDDNGPGRCSVPDQNGS